MYIVLTGGFISEGLGGGWWASIVQVTQTANCVDYGHSFGSLSSSLFQYGSRYGFSEYPSVS